MDGPTLVALANRLWNLEIVVGIFTGAFVLLALASISLVVLTIRRLRLRGGLVFRDHQGRDRISIDDDASMFEFSDEEGQVRMFLGLLDKNPAISLMDESSRLRLTAGLHSENTAMLWMSDRQGESRLAAFMDEEGNPMLLATDTARATRLRLGIVQGEPCLELCDGAGTTWLVAKLDGRDRPSLRMGDELNRMRVVFDSWPSGEPRWYMTNRSGKHRVWAGFSENGEPYWGVASEGDSNTPPASSDATRSEGEAS